MKPRTGSRIIIPAKAFEGETVRIKWALEDGGTYEQDVTIDPKATREARKREVENDSIHSHAETSERLPVAKQ